MRSYMESKGMFKDGKPQVTTMFDTFQKTYKVLYGNLVIAAFDRDYEAEACTMQLAMLSEEELQEVLKEIRGENNA